MASGGRKRPATATCSYDCMARPAAGAPSTWGAEFLAEDKWVRTNGVPARANQWYCQQDAAFRRHLDAFADGINEYAATHGDRLDPAVKVVLPVTAVDVLAHAERVVHFSFIGGAARSIARRWEGGSNAWAIGPSHSATGNAMLLANPHLPWRDFYLFYEAGIVAPGMNAYGATLVGVPVLSIAFNDHLGWTHTVNTIDAHDEYELTLVEGGYRWEGAVRAFDTSEESILVKQKDGSLRAEPLRIRRAVQGPVIAESKGKAVALRVAALDQPGMLQAWWDLGRTEEPRRIRGGLAASPAPDVHGDLRRSGRSDPPSLQRPCPSAAQRELGLDWRRARRHVGNALGPDARLRGSAAGAESAERLASEHQRSAVDDHISPGARFEEVPVVHGPRVDEPARPARRADDSGRPQDLVRGADRSQVLHAHGTGRSDSR